MLTHVPEHFPSENALTATPKDPTMKKTHPLLFVGIFMNLLYAAFLSFYMLEDLIGKGAMPGGVAVHLLAFFDFVLWFSLSLQVLALLLVMWVPRVAFVVGLVGCAAYFPVGLIYAWGLRFTQYEAQYAPFEKTRIAPTGIRATLHYSQGGMFLLSAGMLVVVGLASLYLPFFAPLTKQIFAVTCVFLGVQAYIVGTAMRNHAYFYVLEDKLAFAPVLCQPLVYIPFTAITSASVTERAITLKVSIGDERYTLHVPLIFVAREKRMETSITMRHLMQQVAKASTLVS